MNQTGQVQFVSKITLKEYLQSPEDRKLSGLKVGLQGGDGTLAGNPYAPGSWQDQLIENFAGPYDMISGQWSGFYDAQGNARRGQSISASKAYNAWTVAAIPIAAPFAMAKGLPPGVWEAIQKLVFSK